MIFLILTGLSFLIQPLFAQRPPQSARDQAPNSAGPSGGFGRGNRPAGEMGAGNRRERGLEGRSMPNNPTERPAAEPTSETPDNTEKPDNPENNPVVPPPTSVLKEGTVPKFFNDGPGDQPFSPKAENKFLLESIARREESLAPFAPLKLRRYARYLLEKYDTSLDGRLQRTEWEKLPSAQAMDTDGDFVLREDEILFYITRYSQNRTIFRPNPPLLVEQEHRVVADPTVVIRPLSAPFKPITRAEANKMEAKKGLGDISEAEFKRMLERDSADTFSDTTSQTDYTNEDNADQSTNMSTNESNGDKEDLEAELFEVLLREDDKTQVREFTVPPEQLKDMPRWFVLRDLNGDGQLSLREFAPFLSLEGVAFFGKLDFNGDGFITPDEYHEFQKKMGLENRPLAR